MRVEHDADALGQLLEERLMRGVEGLERSEFDHRLDLSLENHRQNENVVGRRIAQAGRICGCSRPARS